jgi:DNA-binding NtrC family response regulator
VGASTAHHSIVGRITQIASIQAEVLISGPTGVGKELYARLIHARGGRSGAFVPVNCGAIPQELFENELFGHVGGAYTGAHGHSEGLVAEAEQGTLFLDEIDALSLVSQVKLLRFVQWKEYRRLGEARVRRADVRIIAATNVSLDSAVKAGRFREDLLYRLQVIPIVIPPLASRKDDITVLLSAFVAHYADLYHLEPIEMSPEAERRVFDYSWPGNVRELENCVRYLTCMQLRHPVGPADLPFNAVSELQATAADDPELQSLPLREAKRRIVERFEREYLQRALLQHRGNVTHAARASKKDRRAFFELMRKHGLTAANRYDPSRQPSDEKRRSDRDHQTNTQ